MINKRCKSTETLLGSYNKVEKENSRITKIELFL